MGSSIAVCYDYPTKTAYYVEKDLDFGEFYWDVVDDLRVAQMYTFWQVATIENLMQLYVHRSEVFYRIEVEEGIAEWDRYLKGYVLVEKYMKKKQKKRMKKNL